MKRGATQQIVRFISPFSLKLYTQFWKYFHKMVLGSVGRGYCKKKSGVRIFGQNFWLGCLSAFNTQIACFDKNLEANWNLNILIKTQCSKLLRLSQELMEASHAKSESKKIIYEKLFFSCHSYSDILYILDVKILNFWITRKENSDHIPQKMD